MAALYRPELEERASAKMFRASEACSVCLDAVNDSGERSIAKLKCGHHFHLDCIGSAFNAKGAMQCPNCRHIEHGQWLYANGLRWNDDDILLEDISYDDDYDLYQALPSFIAGSEPFGHFEWCPYQLTSPNPYPQFQVSLGEEGFVGFPEVLVNLYSSNERGGASSPPPVCPHLAAQGLRHPRHAQVPEDTQLQSPATHGPLHPPLRPLDLLGTLNGGSEMEDGVGVFSAQNRDIWGHRPSELSLFPGYRDDAPVMAHPSLATFSGDMGTPCMPSNGRHWAWPVSHPEAQRLTGPSSNPFEIYSPFEGLLGESGSLPHAPCPRPHSINGQVGTSQPHQNSSRSGPTGSGARTRHSGTPFPFPSALRNGATSDGPRMSGLRSRHGLEAARALGAQEPPVPGRDLHGPGYSSFYQGCPWRRDIGSGPSTCPWVGSGGADVPRRSRGRPTTDLQPTSIRRGNSLGINDGQGGIPGPSTDVQTELHRSISHHSSPHLSYFQPSRQEGTPEVGSLSSPNFFWPLR